MTSELHVVNQDLCAGDGVCVDVCPKDALRVVDGTASTVPDRAECCIRCGQCVAVCPNDALHMPTIPDDRFEGLPDAPFAYDELLNFLKRRRSVRVFKVRPVERELLDKIVAAAATAPMGLPPHSTEVVVIDRKDELDLLLMELVQGYAFMVRGFANPIGRLLVRLMAGAESYRMLKDHIIDIVTYANQAYYVDGSDRYTHNAPAVLLFHGSRRALSYVENGHLVCHHAMLAAAALGLGATIIGLIPPIVDRSKHLRARYGIPDGNQVLSALVVGYPKYGYRKAIRRDLERTWVA